MNIVKELRKKAGIQQKELALTIGVSRPTVSDWEAHKKDPSGDRLKRLAEYFNVDELVVLGKNVVDLSTSFSTSNAAEPPKTIEARILAEGIDKLPQEQREQALNVVRAMFSQYPQLFVKGKE